jgi:cytochrome c oxidase subunit III
MAPTSGKTLANELSEERSLEHSGMVIFLGSWAMMFGALFFSYAVLRIGAVVWPTPGFARLPLGLPGINTLLLLTSSWTLARAQSHSRRGQLRRCRYELLRTLALGVVFVALQCKVWADLWRSGLRLDSGAYGGTFYVLTVFHLLHVLVGMGLLARLVGPLLRRVPVAPGRVSILLAAMFWHFVGCVWLAMFVAVYVL